MFITGLLLLSTSSALVVYAPRARSLPYSHKCLKGCPSQRISTVQRHLLKRRSGTWQRAGAQLKDVPGQEDRRRGRDSSAVQETRELGGAASVSSSPYEIPKAGGSAEQEEGNVGRILIWVLTLMVGIGLFYGSVSMASNALSLWLKDRVSFTKKDFVPYSERRRLEQLSSESGPTVMGPAVPREFEDVLKLIPSAKS